MTDTAEGRDLPSILFDPEVNRAIHEALPGAVVDALAVLTRLGDGATLVALAAILYWFGAEPDRESRATVLAIAVATLALVAGLKGIFEVQRPLYAADPALAFAPETYPGWSTPSAHAMGAAAVYGGLAVVMDVGRRWQRYVVAGVVIATVALSRVVLGLHYVGDVLLGVALGLLLVSVAVRVGFESVTPLFALSLVIALAGLALGSREFTEMAIGASVGGLVVWPLVRDRRSNALGAAMLLLGLGVLLLLTVVRLLDVLFVVVVAPVLGGLPTVVGALPDIVAAVVLTVGYAVAFGAALAVPFAAAALNDTRGVRWLQTVLPFTGRIADPEAVGEAPELDDGRG